MILLNALDVQAQNVFHVRAGASGSGNGLNWKDAYTSLPSTLIRGATYYIADGSYGSYVFDDPSSGSLVTTILKATPESHGTPMGWQDSYGDGAAIFERLVFSSDNWVFDGQVGGGPGAWNVGHGFVIYSTANVLVTLSGSRDNIVIRHTKMYSDRGTTFIAGVKGTTGSANRITLAYCEISNIFGVILHINNWTNCTIEYNYFFYNKSTATMHAEGISSIGTNSNIVIRYNLWDKIEGTAVLAGVNYGSSDNWQIYGNIFSRSVTPIYYYWEDPGTNQNSMSNSKFLNNTIVGIPSGVSQGAVVIQRGSNNLIYNNIWYANVANSFRISGTHDYQYGDNNIRIEGCSPPNYCPKDSELVSGETSGQAKAGDPFLDYKEEPLVADLRAMTENGMDTSSIVSGNSTDMRGIIRGHNGVWARGALERGVSEPKGLRITSN